jgi:flagellar basal-body rod modification protein FlgD
MVNAVQNPNASGLPAANSFQTANRSGEAMLPPAAAGAAALAKSAAATDANGANTQDRFLKLLVTQMKNQDPLNPMDNAQVTSQMAQLSTVSGIDKLNSTLKALSDNMSTGQAMSATGIIGHGALVAGSTLALNNGKAVGGLELTQGADSVRVQIMDGANNVVRVLQLGAQKAGVVPLTWDGMNNDGDAAPSGSYKFTAEAMNADQKSAVKTLSFGMVEGLKPATVGSPARVDVGKLGDFNLSDIKQVM